MNSNPTPSPNKPAGRYVGRVSRYKIYSPALPVTTLWSATVVFVDGEGVEHATGYEHPTYPRLPGDTSYRDIAQIEADDVADGFQDFLDFVGVRWELQGYKATAPRNRSWIPFFADIEAAELLAA